MLVSALFMLIYCLISYLGSWHFQLVLLNFLSSSHIFIQPWTLFCLGGGGRCAILVVSHGDPLQLLQTVLNAAKEQEASNCFDFASRIEAVKVPSILSKHRKFGLDTGELRAVA